MNRRDVMLGTAATTLVSTTGYALASTTGAELLQDNSPLTFEKVKDLCRSRTPGIITTLEKLMNSSNTPASIRLEIAKTFLSIAYDK